MRLSGRRAAVQHALGPLGGNRVSTPNSAQKRATNGGVGVGDVSVSHDGDHQSFLQVHCPHSSDIQSLAIHRLFTSATIAAASAWLRPEVRVTLGILISFRN